MTKEPPVSNPNWGIKSLTWSEVVACPSVPPYLVPPPALGCKRQQDTLFGGAPAAMSSLLMIKDNNNDGFTHPPTSRTTTSNNHGSSGKEDDCSVAVVGVKKNDTMIVGIDIEDVPMSGINCNNEGDALGVFLVTWDKLPFIQVFAWFAPSLEWRVWRTM